MLVHDHPGWKPGVMQTGMVLEQKLNAYICSESCRQREKTGP